ncbi:MAG: YmdB family metallophosphoesterase [Clostridia bacterium]|nr:YmdB family metallophosphoesterase [Clostridia bacterium]
MRILAIGDVTSPAGLEHLTKNLWRVREKYRIDFCIVNGENASLVTGISEDAAKLLLRSGADVISGGNHTLRNRSVYSFLDEERAILRPLNFGDAAPGEGFGIFDALGYRMLVINVMGTVYMDPVLDSPFSYIDRVLSEQKGRYDFAVLDVHAEATGEKLAIGYAYDGRVNVIFGTHTHVPTADGRILPEGTGYISDLGMCGESEGVLGMDAECVVEKMRTRLPKKFIQARGPVVADGVIFELNTATGRVVDIERVSF